MCAEKPFCLFMINFWFTLFWPFVLLKKYSHFCLTLLNKLLMKQRATTQQTNLQYQQQNQNFNVETLMPQFWMDWFLLLLFAQFLRKVFQKRLILPQYTVSPPSPSPSVGSLRPQPPTTSDDPSEWGAPQDKITPPSHNALQDFSPVALSLKSFHTAGVYGSSSIVPSDHRAVC